MLFYLGSFGCLVVSGILNEVMFDFLVSSVWLSGIVLCDGD